MKEFFLKHELDFLALFFVLNGATTALIAVAAIESNIRYLVAAGICLALATVIPYYGLRIPDEERSR
jgi:hypothetical protein